METVTISWSLVQFHWGKQAKAKLLNITLYLHLQHDLQQGNPPWSAFFLASDGIKGRQWCLCYVFQNKSFQNEK